jgi:hypothetical protein
MIASGIVPVHRQNAGLGEDTGNEENLASAILRSGQTGASQKCAAVAFLVASAIRKISKKIVSYQPSRGGKQEGVVVP